MSDDIHFNYIYMRVSRWFESENEVKRWYTREIIPSFGMTPNQVVEQLGRDTLEHWIEAKNLGCFEQSQVIFEIFSIH